MTSPINDKSEWVKPIIAELDTLLTESCAKSGSFTDAQDVNCTS